MSIIIKQQQGVVSLASLVPMVMHEGTHAKDTDHNHHSNSIISTDITIA